MLPALCGLIRTPCLHVLVSPDLVFLEELASTSTPDSASEPVALISPDVRCPGMHDTVVASWDEHTSCLERVHVSCPARLCAVTHRDGVLLARLTMGYVVLCMPPCSCFEAESPARYRCGQLMHQSARAICCILGLARNSATDARNQPDAQPSALGEATCQSKLLHAGSHGTSSSATVLRVLWCSPPTPWRKQTPCLVRLRTCTMSALQMGIGKAARKSAGCVLLQQACVRTRTPRSKQGP